MKGGRRRLVFGSDDSGVLGVVGVLGVKRYRPLHFGHREGSSEDEIRLFRLGVPARRG
jgi:hypothetical protein